MKETISHIFLFIGLLFDLLGCIGLVRFPDVYLRLMAATKSVTLGTGLILLSVVIAGSAPVAAKAVLVLLFISVTSPTAAHALARASSVSDIKMWEGTVCDKFTEDRKRKTNEKT
ncbi:MAG: monovalent cation/H(+) antiporter subunit G [Candidatus Omnitrophica bacterium]|jgi:multicomponent Na+:H+ antiporter subunit G|nr:monovalent cation/H(+) antiporter subunit G [Candidatus Omnitrophota bacterium]